MHCEHHVGNNDLNSVCQSLHYAHHRSTNFEKAKMCKRNSYFQKSQNTLNVIYTVCAMSEIMILTLFAIVGTVRLSGVKISKSLKCRKQTAISKSFKKHCKCDKHSEHHVGNNDLNYFCHTYHGAHHHSINFEKAKNVQNKLQFRKVSTQFKYEVHNVRHVGNNNLNSFSHS